MMAKACSVKAAKRGAIIDRWSALWSDRTAQVDSWLERMSAQTGLPIPTLGNVKVILDSLVSKTSWLFEHDEATYIKPLNDALKAHAEANGENWEDYKNGVAKYENSNNLIERIQLFITGNVGKDSRLPDKFFKPEGKERAKQIVNLTELYMRSAHIVSAEENGIRVAKINELREELFDPSSESQFFEPGYKDAINYQGKSWAEAEEDLALIPLQYEEFYNQNIELFDNIRNTLNQRRIDSGRHGPAGEFQRASYGWQHYVPFKKGKDKGLEEFFQGFDLWENTGFLNDNDTQRLEGSSKEANNVIDQLQFDLLHSGQKLVNSELQQAIYVAFIEFYGTHNIETSGPLNMTDLDNAKWLGPKPKGGSIARAPNTIIIHQGDSAQVLTINDPDLFVGLKSYWQRSNETATKIYRNTMQPLAMLKTTLNPPWIIYTNFIRDFRNNLIYGTIELGTNEETGKFSFDISKAYLKNVYSFGGLVSALNYHTKDFLGKQELAQQGHVYAIWADKFAKLGGESTFLQALEMEGLQQKMERAYSNSINPDMSLRERIANSKQWKYYTDVLSGVDQSTRVALFKAIVENGKLDEQAAAIYVKNLMNFNYKGRHGDIMRTLYIFYGPAAAGVFRMAHTLFRGDNLVQKYAIMASMATSTGVMYLLANMIAGEDDDGEDVLKKIDDYTLIRNSVIPVLGDNKSMTLIPRALGLETVLAAPGILLARLALGHTTPSRASIAALKTTLDASSFVSPGDPGADESAMSMGKAILNSFMPTLLRPFNEASVNLDSNGLQIWNQYIDKNKPAYMQGRDNTDEFWKLLSKVAYDPGAMVGMPTPAGLDLPPEVIKYVFQQHAGFLGSTFNRVINYNDKVLRGDTITLSDIPGAPTITTKDVIFYPQRSFSQVQGEWRVAVQGYNIKLEEGFSPDPDEKLAYSLDQQVNKYDRKISESVNKIQDAPNMSPEEKGKRIKALMDHRALIRLDLVKKWEKQTE